MSPRLLTFPLTAGCSLGGFGGCGRLVSEEVRAMGLWSVVTTLFRVDGEGKKEGRGKIMGTGIRWDFFGFGFFGVFSLGLTHSASLPDFFLTLFFIFIFVIFFFSLPYFFLVPIFLVPPMIAAVGPSVGYGSGPREKVWL
ncbi:hypothetical protein ASPFODRAFT_601365 [Aspergillus luchuensis CBS 106.47]|uniref:Transmembrane protein n=1 Tax=Aspergillus luchuensis (strain CBS 106.47) TaxID=1137211 RepID=A0A1M3TID7_ASPLC|nr:hypothetical protein ASPFODRAFT_601365 [Aspergillus luchuensis CBS 106.47]